MLKVTFWVALCTLWFVGCAPAQPEKFEEEDSSGAGGSYTSKQPVASSRSATGPSNAGLNAVRVPVSVSPGGGVGLVGFNLIATADDYSITLDGCESGYTSTVNAADGDLLVYQFDHNCLAKLNSFQFNSITYAHASAGGTNFTDWSVYGTSGETAVFTDGGANIMYVRIQSQLDNPISGAEPVNYQFFQVISGNDDTTILGTDIDNAHVLTVDGVSAPPVNIGSVAFVGMTVTGNGQFTFKIDCNVNVTSSGATTMCADVQLTEIEYVLVQDTFGSTLNIAQAEALFDTSEKAVVVGDLITIADADAAVPHGGFQTDTVAPLEGPVDMHLNPNMLLVLRNNDASYTEKSYTYFNVDITVLNQ